MSPNKSSLTTAALAATILGMGAGLPDTEYFTNCDLREYRNRPEPQSEASKQAHLDRAAAKRERKAAAKAARTSKA